MARLNAVVLVACGSCATLLGTALLYAGPAFPVGQARHPATTVTPAPARPGDRASDGNPAGSPGEAIDPALFSPGACLAFAPTSGDRNETVFLDAGHGGIDPGAVGSTETGAPVNEAAVNLSVELDTMAILRAEGYRVVVSRTQDTTVTNLTPADVDGGLLTVQGVVNDVGARDVCANLAGADVLVGIYMDSGSPWNAGCVTGYDAVRPFSAANLRLATLLQDDVLGAMNAQGWDIPDEGVMPDTVLGSALDSAALAYGHLILLGPAKAGYFTTPSQMPGALIEPLFVTDPFEGSIAASPHGQQVISAALAEAINQYFA
jgi:N-acetylmuramoyl-L-alanine amidase